MGAGESGRVGVVEGEAGDGAGRRGRPAAVAACPSEWQGPMGCAAVRRALPLALLLLGLAVRVAAGQEEPPP